MQAYFSPDFHFSTLSHLIICLHVLPSIFIVFTFQRFFSHFAFCMEIFASLLSMLQWTVSHRFSLILMQFNFVEFISSPLVAPLLVQQVIGQWFHIVDIGKIICNSARPREKYEMCWEKALRLNLAFKLLCLLPEFMFVCFDWFNSENAEWEFLYCSIYDQKRG